MRILGSFTLFLLAGCASTPDYAQPLPASAEALIPMDPGEFPDLTGAFEEKSSLRESLDQSLAWIVRPHAASFFPAAGISHGRVHASLERLSQLLDSCPDARSFAGAVEGEFEAYRSAGWNGRGGGVLFTAYYTPILDGRLHPNDVFAYPLYAKPPELESTASGEVLGMRIGDDLVTFPARRSIEERGIFTDRGLELVWLASPLDAYLAHVQGSAFVRLADGSLRRYGFAGTNGRDYTSLAKVLMAAGELEEGARLPEIREFAREHPDRLRPYLWENERYVFFTPIDSTPHGSLDVPVTPLRTVATDKRLFPRAAPVFVEAQLATGVGNDARPFEQLAFDQDTGGGIRTAGRADLYVGVGEAAGEIAGRTHAAGQLTYLLLREELVPRYLP